LFGTQPGFTGWISGSGWTLVHPDPPKSTQSLKSTR
jgi:hypothetical protein